MQTSGETNFYYFLARYIKVHKVTRWTITHSLILLWFKDLMNVTQEVKIHRPKITTLLSGAFIRGEGSGAS